MAKKTRLRQARHEINARRPAGPVRVTANLAGGHWKLTALPEQSESPADDAQAEATRARRRDMPSADAVASAEDLALIAANQERIAALRQRPYGPVYDLDDVRRGEGRLVAAIGATGLGMVSVGSGLVQGDVFPAFAGILVFTVGTLAVALAITLVGGRTRDWTGHEPAGALKRRAHGPQSGEETADAQSHQRRTADATVEEVGSAGPKVGFDGKPLPRPPFEGTGPGI